MHRDDLGMGDASQEAGSPRFHKSTFLGEPKHPLPEEVRDRGPLERPDKFLFRDRAFPVELTRDADRATRGPDGQVLADQLGVARRD